MFTQIAKVHEDLPFNKGADGPKLSQVDVLENLYAEFASFNQLLYLVHPYTVPSPPVIISVNEVVFIG